MSGKSYFSRNEAINFLTVEPSVLVFPVKLNGAPINGSNYCESFSGLVKSLGDFGGTLKSLFILKNLVGQ
jgi:hypothetical protein